MAVYAGFHPVKDKIAPSVIFDEFMKTDTVAMKEDLIFRDEMKQGLTTSLLIL